MSWLTPMAMKVQKINCSEKISMKTTLIKAAGFVCVLVFTPALAADLIRYDVAVLQGLNKVTARVSEFRAPVGQPVTFGSLEITARDCRKSSPEDTPESVSFLEIDDMKENVEKTRIFTGWMFASSPAVSAMEHPVYDVWLVNCGSSTDVPKDPADLVPDTTIQSSE
ncbi:DUF2155 domain-containing protein [Kiloniella antarctica]|uniref:DUF2155 domain-containing protein n=1 Tax=Kiloniella antarctica TaxID=1550907 RepID=A0ABW5BJA8_9PROT